MARASVELHRVAAEMRRIPDAGLYASGKLVKKLADDAARSVTGDGTMAGHKKRAIKLRARDKGIRPLNGGRALLVQGVPAGPWVWMTTGTEPHTTRRRKRGPMSKMTVHHPGVRRRRGAWLRVVDRAGELVPRVFADLVDRTVN